MISFPKFESNDFLFARDLISAYEFLLLPFYLILFYYTAYLVWRYKFDEDKTLRRYYYMALTLKLTGALIICLIYNYYYKGGDTNAYHNDARLINEIFWHDPSSAIKLYFSSQETLLSELGFYGHTFRFLKASDTFMVVRLTSIIELFTFNSFVITSITFGFLSFFCLWLLFLTVYKSYPRLKNQLAIAILFVPSLIIWGSGIFKDTICLSLLCIIYVIIHNWVQRSLSLQSVVIFVLAIYILALIKVYIVMMFAISAMFYIMVDLTRRLRNIIIKLAMAPIIIALCAGGVYYMVDELGKNSKRSIYSIDNILTTAEITANYLQYLSDRDQSSGYDLGDIDYTFVGLLSKAPEAINVTLFRPYLWEARKPIMVPSAVESFIILSFTFYVFFRNGLLKSLRVIYNHTMISAFLLYSLTFAFAIGITTFNFGSLVRYKIPILPFYLLALILINHYSKVKDKPTSQSNV